MKDLNGAYRGGYRREQVELKATVDAPEADGWVRVHYDFTDCLGRSGDHYSEGFKGVAAFEMPGATAKEPMTFGFFDGEYRAVPTRFVKINRRGELVLVKPLRDLLNATTVSSIERAFHRADKLGKK